MEIEGGWRLDSRLDQFTDDRSVELKTCSKNLNEVSVKFHGCSMPA